MRIAKSIFFVQLLIFLTVTNASGYYFGGLDDYSAAVPSQEEKEPFATSGRETLFTGTIAGIVREDSSLIVEMEVPGFFGPEKVTQPISVGKDDTVNICYRDTGECKVLGTNGFESIASLSPEELKNASVYIMGYAEDQSRIISIETEKGPA